MRATSGAAATTASQPIATYSPVDQSGCLSRSSSLTVTPSTAIVQIVANSDQPQPPRSTPSTNGV